MIDLVSPRVALGEALCEIGAYSEDLVVIDTDVRPASSLDEFYRLYPGKFIQGGIAEQNAMCIAGGISTTGMIPFYVSFGMFTGHRAGEQLYTSIGYAQANAKIVGTYTGFCGVKNGVTHQPIADTAFIKAIPGMTLLEPADAVEVKQAIKAAYDFKGPVYIRLGRDPIPVIFDERHRFEIGKGYTVLDGRDLTIISTGIMLSYAIKAAETLKMQNISVCVVHMPTIKPIDREIIIKAAVETGAILTVENSNISGGFGSAVTEVVCEEHPIPVLRYGIRDVFGESGYFDELAEKYGFGVKDLVEGAKALLLKKR